jgi:hypothetical protein
MISIRPKILSLAALALGLSTFPPCRAATTAVVTSAPVGLVTLEARGGAGIQSLAVPLESSPAYVGVVSGVLKRTLVVKGANWTVSGRTPSDTPGLNPLVVRMTSGRGDGRTFEIDSRGGNRLRLATSEDLTATISKGDRFEILPSDTLGSLFGTDGRGLTTDENPDHADNVSLLKDGKWETYYHNGHRWLRVGDASRVNRNATTIVPGEGFLFVRRTATPFALQVSGNVPEDAAFSAPPTVSLALVGNPFPTGRRLGAIADELDLERGRGWDSISVRTAGGWRSYFPRGQKWVAEDGSVSRRGPMVNAGAAVLVERGDPGTNP